MVTIVIFWNDFIKSDLKNKITIDSEKLNDIQSSGNSTRIKELSESIAKGIDLLADTINNIIDYINVKN